MARVLFTSTQGVGHFRPLQPFIASCRRTGHEVALVVPPALEAIANEENAIVHIGADPPSAELGPIWGRVREATHEEAAQLVLGEVFGRLKPGSLLPVVRQVVASWRPDLVVHESAEFAGAIAAEEAGVPHAVVAVSRASTDMIDIVPSRLDRFLPGICDRIRESPFLTVFPASLDADCYEQTHRIQPPSDIAEALPDFWPGQDGPLVYVTFGTVTRDTAVARAAFSAAIEAVNELPARVLVTTGGELPNDALPVVAPNVRIEHWVRQADILPHAEVVVCHGGSGTTIGALAAGVPLVLVPLFADQQTNAQVVDAAGAGVAVAYEGDPVPAQRALTETDIPRIREAVLAVMADESFRASAERIAAEMASAMAIDTAWSLLLA